MHYVHPDKPRARPDAKCPKLKTPRRRVKLNKKDQGGADTKKGSFGSAIRQDLPYLRLIVNEAVRLHPRRPPEEHVMLANLREYLM